MDAFHDVRFPLAIAFGATGGPEWRNEILQMRSGREVRNARFAGSRRRYDVGAGVRSLADLHELLAFFEARRGSLHGFRFRDPFDMKSCAPQVTAGPLDQTLGSGDGVNRIFQLAKTYGEGGDAVRRKVTRPVEGSVLVAVNGVEIGSSFRAIDHATGLVTFAPWHAPAAGHAVTAGFEFDVPVRFDVEHLAVSITSFRAGQVPNAPLLEVLE